MKAAIFPNTVNVHLFYKGCTLPFDNSVDLRKGSYYYYYFIKWSYK